MAEQRSKPRAIPSLIASWTWLIFIIFVLGPTSRAISAQRETAPPLASFMAVLVILGFIAAIWAAVGAARLRTIPVGITLAVLIGYPLLVVAKALVTGYFSSWVFRFTVFIVLVNGSCAWYLLRSKVRGFWSPSAPRNPA
jgi:hypothetical protein